MQSAAFRSGLLFDGCIGPPKGTSSCGRRSILIRFAVRYDLQRVARRWPLQGLRSSQARIQTSRALHLSSGPPTWPWVGSAQFSAVSERNRIVKIRATSPRAALQQTRQIDSIILSTFASSRSMAGLVPSNDPFIGPSPSLEECLNEEGDWAVLRYFILFE
jgi:hypothetical protein